MGGIFLAQHYDVAVVLTSLLFLLIFSKYCFPNACGNPDMYSLALALLEYVFDVGSSCLDWLIHQSPLFLPLTRQPLHPPAS